MSDSNRKPNDYADFEDLSRRVRALEVAAASQAGHLVSDDSNLGIVLKSSSGHYWRVTIDFTGALVTTDLGWTRPTR